MLMDDAKTLGTGTLRDLHNVGKSVPYTKFRQMKSKQILLSGTLCAHLETTGSLVMEGR